jgi:galactose mutarotase-like enzyme
MPNDHPVDRHHLGAGTMAATILAHGAELARLDCNGHALLWAAGPAWPRHAPVLFPIVGRLTGDRLHASAATTRLTQHGFARDQTFHWIERGPARCRLLLTDSPATRALFPFPFELELSYTLAGGALRIGFLIANPGAATLPVSAGAHPAFRWPLFPGVPKHDHTLRFEHPEPAPIRRLRDGLLRAEPEPSPIDGNILRLDPLLFADDAIILDRPRSTWARLAVPDGRGLTVAWQGFSQLGIWSKPPDVPNADFICIEPWQGTASPAEFDGPFIDKPGLMLIPPNGQRQLNLSIIPATEPSGG